MADPAAFSFKASARFADNLYRARERAGLSELVEGVTWKPGWVEDSGPAEYVVSDDSTLKKD